MCASTILVVIFFASAQAIYKECENVPNGTFVPAIEHQNNCLSFIFCDGEKSFQDDCPLNTYFNNEQQACDIDDNFVCEEYLQEIENNNNEKESTFPTIKPIVMQHSLPSNSSTTSNVSTSSIPKCNPNSNVLHAHETRCEYYYKCFNGYLTILRCAFGYGWDYKQQKCLRIAEAQCFHK